jgi:C4-type Zn-finger protein
LATYLQTNKIIMEVIKCPKCQSTDVQKETSFGGPAVYRQLVCKQCGFQGGHSRVYNGEEARVEREIVARFLDKENQPDGVRTTLAAHGL